MLKSFEVKQAFAVAPPFRPLVTQAKPWAVRLACVMCHGLWPGEVPAACKLGARNTACRNTIEIGGDIQRL